MKRAEPNQQRATKEWNVLDKRSRHTHLGVYAHTDTHTRATTHTHLFNVHMRKLGEKVTFLSIYY